jgi:hypothetical protein
MGSITSERLKQPTLSAEHIGFVYAGDIWVAELDGRHPRRLTAQKGVSSTSPSPQTGSGSPSPATTMAL